MAGLGRAMCHPMAAVVGSAHRLHTPVESTGTSHEVPERADAIRRALEALACNLAPCDAPLPLPTASSKPSEPMADCGGSLTDTAGGEARGGDTNKLLPGNDPTDLTDLTGLDLRFELHAPRDCKMAPLLRVHSERYLQFLETAYAEWCAAEGDTGATVPLSFCIRQMTAREPEHITGKIGYFSMDGDTPITKGTYAAAREAANIALTGAQLLHEAILAKTAEEEQPAVFALCRPPGHHAGRDHTGGFCYLNNSAVAAQHLLDQGCAKVAVLDVDYHHGNGIQDIFYRRSDVLYVSIHGDPRQEYPFFSGYADEEGEGEGKGFNLNLPLPWGTETAGYLEALATGLKRVAAFEPDRLVVALGVDTFKGDPLCQFRLSTLDFGTLGQQVRRLGLPTLVCLEGGYALAAIADNVLHFLAGINGTTPPGTDAGHGSSGGQPESD